MARPHHASTFAHFVRGLLRSGRYEIPRNHPAIRLTLEIAYALEDEGLAEIELIRDASRTIGFVVRVRRDALGSWADGAGNPVEAAHSPPERQG